MADKASQAFPQGRAAFSNNNMDRVPSYTDSEKAQLKILGKKPEDFEDVTSITNGNLTVTRRERKAVSGQLK